jgi:hypothetical protein
MKLYCHTATTDNATQMNYLNAYGLDLLLSLLTRKNNQ